MTERFRDDGAVMRRALTLAARGLGSVEPNPAVGAVLVAEDGEPIGEGWHRSFGGPHAEVNAIADARRRSLPETFALATMYVTLEPCCHHGQTPPCTQAVIDAGIGRVVVAMQDPAPHANGRGIRTLRAAGIDVRTGLLEAEARRLNAPFIKLLSTGLPYVHAKWAMTLDGKIAARTGASRWISNEASRGVVHRLRGRMDAIVVGAQTARVDDPLLTARPPGPRVACRIVVDSRASLSLDSRLVRTAGDAPVLVAATSAAPAENVQRLRAAGVEVQQLPATGSSRTDVTELLAELGRRRMTNILVEGGGELLGEFFDREAMDEVHVFVAPTIVGGAAAKSPVAGAGLAEISDRSPFASTEFQVLGHDVADVYIHGVLHSKSPRRQGAS